MTDPNAAEVLERDGPEAIIDAEEKASAEADKAGGADPEADAAKTDEEIHRRKGGYLRKLEKKDEQIAILVEALRKVGGMPAEAAKETKTENPDEPPKKPIRPKITDFDDLAKFDAAVDAYEEQRDKYAQDLVKHELKQADKARQAQGQQKEAAQGWEKKISEARKMHADFDEVAFSEDTPLSLAMQDAIIDSEHGTEILYHLGQNQAEAARIAKLSPIAAIREIGKIESRIADTNKAEPEDKEPPATASRAPRPPQPVRRQSSVNSEPDDKDEYSTWLRKREAQLKARNG